MTTLSPYAIYRDHLLHGRLAYQYSHAADQAVFFPRSVSPHDTQEQLEWRISKGMGTVYSATSIHTRDKPPYSVVLVDCDEGFRLMSRVEKCSAADVYIGMRVQFSVHTPVDGDDPYPVFIPIAGT